MKQVRETILKAQATRTVVSWAVVSPRAVCAGTRLSHVLKSALSPVMLLQGAGDKQRVQAGPE